SPLRVQLSTRVLERGSALCRITRSKFLGRSIRADPSMLKIFGVAAFFAAVSLCCGQVPVAGNVPGAADELVVAKVPKLPAIDGKADDEAWKAAKEIVVKIDQPDEETPKKTISI